jgi:O-antigen/teichoic acid export membrane protein
VFVIVSLNALEGGAKAAFSAFWAVIFVAGPGFFLPLEQEIGRALAHRRAQNEGGGPLIARAARLGGMITVLLVVAAIALTSLLNERLYHDDLMFVPALAVGLVGFYLAHTTRGVLAGEGRFRAYAVLIGAEGVVRLCGALALAAFGVHRAGAYALVLGLAPFVAVAIALWGQKGIMRPGPPAPWSELSTSLGWLLLGSVFTQALAYSPLLVVNLMATPDEKAIVAGFASAFFVARVPVLAFQAIQGTLLPKLAGLAGSGRHDDFRQGINKLLMLVVGVAVAGTLGALVLGPWIGKILFKDFTLSARGLALLAAGSGAFIVALTLAQALMALAAHRAMALSWATGLFVCGVVVAVIPGLELRAELGFLAGAIVAAVVMAVVARSVLARVGDVGIEPLLQAIEQEPIEI